MARWLLISWIALIAVKTVASTSSLYPALSYTHDGEHNATEDIFAPVQPIPGSDLFTGIYYNLGLEHFPSGWVTWVWTTPTGSTRHYMQIDSISASRGKYLKNGIWYNDAQWFFVPSQTKPGWYYLKNRQLSDRVAMISKGERVGNGFHIIFAKDLEQDHSPALWKPVAQGHNKTGPYKLIIKSEPHGTVTWTTKRVLQNVADAYFIQVDVNQNAEHKTKYEKNREWYVGSLFRIKQGDRQMIGEITQLQLLPKLNELQNLIKVERKRNSLSLANGESRPGTKHVQEQILHRGSLSLKLQDFPEMKTVGSEGPISPALYAASAMYSPKNREFSSSEEIGLNTVEIYEINKTVMVPGWSATDLWVFREYFDTEGSAVDTDAWVYMTLSQKGAGLRMLKITTKQLLIESYRQRCSFQNKLIICCSHLEAR